MLPSVGKAAPIVFNYQRECECFKPGAEVHFSRSRVLHDVPERFLGRQEKMMPDVTRYRLRMIGLWKVETTANSRRHQILSRVLSHILQQMLGGIASGIDRPNDFVHRF